MMKMLLIIWFLIFSTSIYRSCLSLSCKNEDNKDVDWFIMLKIPASYNYFYLSSDSKTGTWAIPNYALNNDNNLLAVTLRQMYDSQRSGAFFALYNDERPRKMRENIPRESNAGHLKGVINFDKKTGYWLVHSVPKFPSKHTYRYTNGESINGQSFLCVSLDISNLKSIGRQLLLMYADVYSYNLPSDFTSDSDLLTTLYNLVTNAHSPGIKTHTIDLATLNGVKLSHFGKSDQDYRDIYLDIICPRLNVSLFVESWMNGPGEKLRSNCATNNKVYNVQDVSIDGVQYSEEVDHSKWAVSNDQSNPLICIGDLNRMVTQMSRGGGSLCLHDLPVWKVFSSIVKKFEPCKKFDFIL